MVLHIDSQNEIITMAMSKIRNNIELTEGELQVPAETDLQSFAIFTQKHKGKPHVFAGFVEASDPTLALAFGREHYGQDEECTNIWAFPETAIASDDPSYPPPADSPENITRSYQVFTQKRGTDWHKSTEEITAEGPISALAQAKRKYADQSLHAVWVVPVELISQTEPGDMIWRFVDQNYRLARGYAKDVRDKWERLRSKDAVDEYQKDDLKETF